MEISKYSELVDNISWKLMKYNSAVLRVKFVDLNCIWKGVLTISELSMKCKKLEDNIINTKKEERK